MLLLLFPTLLALHMNWMNQLVRLHAPVHLVILQRRLPVPALRGEFDGIALRISHELVRWDPQLLPDALGVFVALGNGTDGHGVVECQTLGGCAGGTLSLQQWRWVRAGARRRFRGIRRTELSVGFVAADAAAVGRSEEGRECPCGAVLAVLIVVVVAVIIAVVDVRIVQAFLFQRHLAEQRNVARLLLLLPQTVLLLAARAVHIHAQLVHQVEAQS
mmetsp:Transcript_15026/g.42435  ORF Transcript_15026/g.42435 Transcript_15026/m.42435 type:complete len:217 (-) Transcript_15026:108-758(-)